MLHSWTGIAPWLQHLDLAKDGSHGPDGMNIRISAEMTRTPRILIVEDQHVAALDCQGELARAGMDTVGIASTAAEAYLLAGREKPDLILMDIRLASRADGIETAREIYEQYGIRSIFVTAQGTPETREQAKTAHPVGWISKPYRPSDLVKSVKDALDEVLAASSSAQP
jgi:two-component system, response regulator PdtaR